MQKREPPGLYFEDFEIGKTYRTPRRTVTQTDIVNFACLSGDFNAPHVDWEFCKQQPYGEPIAHGPLVLAIAGGLMCQSGINDGTIAAMMGVDAWRIHKPVKHGHTSEAVMTGTDTSLSRQRDQDIVTSRRQSHTQHAE